MEEYHKYEAEQKEKIRSALVKYHKGNWDESSAETVRKNSSSLKRGIPIDLIYLSEEGIIFIFEIKMSGGLDTKNRESNAVEVLRNEKLFSFFGADKVKSYFAACYNNAGGDDGSSEVKNEKGVLFRGKSSPEAPMFNIVNSNLEMSNKIIVGSVFWEKVLPKGLQYSNFLNAYKRAFKKSKIEEKIIEL